MPIFPVTGSVGILDKNGNQFDSVADPETPTLKRLAAEVAIKPGSVIGIAAGAGPVTDSVIEQLLDGGSADMVVNGSITPVVFDFTADPTDDIILTKLRLVMTAGAINWSAFGKGGGLLGTDGVQIKVRVNGAGASTEIFKLRQNEDFIRMQNPITEFVSTSGDVIAGEVSFNGTEKLTAGSADNVSVTINDNLTAGARSISYFTATLYGFKQV